MTQKELDSILGKYLETQLSPLHFNGRGHGTARRWEREVPNTGIRQTILTPCVPIRGAGAVVNCGTGIRFEEIENELADLTKDSNCFKASRDTGTIGASLQDIENTKRAMPSWFLIDATSAEECCRELMEIINADVIPWLDNNVDYESAHNKLLLELALYPNGNCVSAIRALLIERKLGLPVSGSVLSVLTQTVSNDDIGADVCRKILAQP